MKKEGTRFDVEEIEFFEVFDGDAFDGLDAMKPS